MRAGGIHWAATMDAKGFSEGAARIKKEASNLGGFLKDSLGKRSFLKEFSEISVGGGAIAGVSAFANMLSETAKTAAELRKELESGAITKGEFKSRLVELVPVLGSIARAGREIGESLATAFNPDVLKFERQAQIMNEQGAARAEAFKRLDKFRNETKQIGMTPEAIKHLEGNAELFAINEALAKNAGGMNPEMLSQQVFDAWQDRVRKELEEIDKTNKKIEQDFNRAADAVDADIRRQVVIGVNDPMTLHMLDWQKQQAEITKQKRNELTSRARGLFGEWSSSADRTTGAMTRGSAAALSAISANARTPLQQTADLMRELVRIAKDQLRAEQEQARAWDDVAMLEIG